MQIIQLELNHENFFCPVTGQNILLPNEPCNDDAIALMGYWVDEIIEEPFLKNEMLQKDFENFMKNSYEVDEDFFFGFDDLEDFLTSFKVPNWVMYKITTCGMGCGGPISSTVYLVMDMDVDVDVDVVVE